MHVRSYFGGVLGPLRDVAGVLQLAPDPRVIVDGRRALEAPPRLGQLGLSAAGQQRQQRLRRAVAEHVVAAED